MKQTTKRKPFILGIIPARGGSKDIRGKNIRLVGGKPLLAWTIEAARSSRLLDRFVVSTDSRNIKRIARRCNADVLDRPAFLATDTADTWEVLNHALSKMAADVVVLLQPTSPVRDKGLIDRCIKTFLERKADNLATGFNCKFKEYGTYSARRQDLKGFFYDDGNVYVIKANLIRQHRRTGKKIIRLETTREQNVEIDDMFDLWLAGQILRKRTKQ